MYCGNCNAKLGDKIEVCPYCHEKTGYEKPAASNLSKSINTWFWILCFVVPIVGIVFFFIHRSKVRLPFLNKEQYEELRNPTETTDIAILAKTESVLGININETSYEEYAALYDVCRKDNNDKMLSFREAFAYGLIMYLFVISIIFIIWMTILGCNPNAK